ncbi:MAG TPA: DSD1 family PLP-dependent enzyme, partial [Polyangiales bacterium]|nr:DSD1 family PLP-dependent enzyme [Polyangiales bacterium]
MLDDQRLHGALIGKPGSRERLNTPALVIELDALERNLQKMASLARSKGVRLRPHAKTHKSAHIAKRQIAGGAVGICCAKLGEAEALAAEGVNSILLTSPVVTMPGLMRLASLNAQLTELIVVVDHPDNARLLAKAVFPNTLQVLIDVDPGIRRTGVTTPEAAVQLYEVIKQLPQLRYRGVQYYCGLQQHVASFAERRTAIVERTEYLRSVIAQLESHGGKPEIVSGGGTGTCHIDAELSLLNEWQVGSYVFMDRQYADCDLAGDAAQAFDFALFVDTRVVSANSPGLATCDAGFKALATDAGPPAIVYGAPAGATYHFMGDEHGLVVDPELKNTWELADKLSLAVPHCDPTVNLYDAYHVVRGDTLVEIWPVSARGRSR